VVFIDGDANEGVVVVDADLGYVPRVVADGDGLPHEGRQRGREVALALKVDAVALHGSVLWNCQEESVEVFQTFGHPGKPAVGDPSIPW
jgi:hypothetical protein